MHFGSFPRGRTVSISRGASRFARITRFYTHQRLAKRSDDRYKITRFAYNARNKGTTCIRHHGWRCTRERVRTGRSEKYYRLQNIIFAVAEIRYKSLRPGTQAPCYYNNYYYYLYINRFDRHKRWNSYDRRDPRKYTHFKRGTAAVMVRFSVHAIYSFYIYKKKKKMCGLPVCCWPIIKRKLLVHCNFI